MLVLDLKRDPRLGELAGHSAIPLRILAATGAQARWHFYGRLTRLGDMARIGPNLEEHVIRQLAPGGTPEPLCRDVQYVTE